MNWREALLEAERTSRAERCTSYVNAIVLPPMKLHRKPTIDRYEVSNWFADGITVARFDSGVRREEW